MLGLAPATGCAATVDRMRLPCWRQSFASPTRHMNWQSLMIIAKQRLPYSSASAPRLLCIIGLAFAGVLVTASQSSARRRNYHASYSPPSSAMAIDLNTGRILYSKNANEPRYPASLTKVMTLYLLFDALRDGKITMNTKLTVSAHAAAQSPTKLDLSPGDTISVADAIGAIVTKSANDMAVVVAEALAGSEEEFARRMTQKARTIGMLNTTFRNASGLPNPDQHTTAQDLIVLGQSVLADHPERCKVFSTRYFQYDGNIYRNHNTMLFNYAGMEGMKTGFTTASGFNLIATARRGDKRLLAVVLGGPSSSARNAAMRNILDNSWGKASTQLAARKAGVTVAALKAAPQQPQRAQSQTAKANEAAVASAQPGRNPALASLPLSQISQVRTKPDRVSAAMLLSAMESGLVLGPQVYAQRNGAEPASSDSTTDEPDDTVAGTAKTNQIPPGASKGTIALEAASAQPVNVSVHYKTVRPPAPTQLTAVAVNTLPETAAVKPEQAVMSVTSGATPEPQTLGAATAATSKAMDQPGPFHIQVGAFPDQAQAEQRLESVKEMLGNRMIKAHPEFVMQISLPAGTTMFRARLSRFADEAQAKSVCKTLRHSGIECMDIKAQ
jgi:D-alanyl-D-alanine carboxypeptidase